tara:strand:- start:852 stop:1109 length:258 start_codon:yes stop_codon:yes gene_type:complete
MLPTVSEEVAAQVSTIMGETNRVADSWLDMAESNLVLFEKLTDIAVVASASSREQGEMFLRGAMFVWESLRVQDEVNDMNDQWGL